MELRAEDQPLRLKARINSPVAAALVVAICYAVLFLSLLHARHGDVSRLVIAGGPAVDAAKVPAGLTVIPNIGGYDGMMFYRLALDPFTKEQTAFGIRLDNPPYRQQRIIYPLIVWILSLGHAAWVPALLVGVNIVAAVVMGAFGGAFAKRVGQHALWGVVLPLYPGFALTFSRDLAEILAAAFAIGAIWAITARRSTTGAILLTCAVLTREPALLLAFSLGAAYLIERLWNSDRHIRPVVFVMPVVVDAFWQIFLALRWGVSPLRAGAPGFVTPFVEFARFLAANSPRRIAQQRLYFSESLFLAAVVLTVVVIWRGTHAPLQWRLAWIGYLTLAATLPHQFWLEDYSFLRVFADFFVVSFVLIIPSNTSARWFALATTALLWIEVAKRVVRFG